MPAGTIEKLGIFAVAAFLVSCGPKSVLPTPKIPFLKPGAAAGLPSQPTGEKIDFFPTVRQARDDIASLIQLSETRVDATFSAAEDSVIVKKEEKSLAELQEKEYSTHQDLIVTLDRFLQLIPEGGQMDQNLSKGRGNLVAKYDAYSKSIEAGISDQLLNPLEKTVIESNARSLVSELQFIESSLPLPLDSLKVGPTFVVEADSVDLFFEVVNQIEDVTKEIETLRKTLADYQKAKAEMEAFLEREKAMTQEIQENEMNIDRLYSAVDTVRQEQMESRTNLNAQIRSRSDSLRKLMREVNAAVKTDIASLTSNITDSIAHQQQQTDSLFFQVGTNMELFREQIDSLKGLVRFYDVAEKGLPLLDEDVLNILKLPTLRHKVTLKNGTIVIGQILAENMDVIVMQTSIGKLVIEKDFISKYGEKVFPGPKVVFEGDYELTEYADAEEFSGMVKNIGNKRADFVKVSFFLWSADTEPVGIGSAYVDGATVKFSTSVISDASIEPNATANYHVRVEKQKGRKVSYRTNEVKWREFD